MRYLLGFLVTIGLIVLIIFLLLTGGGSKKSSGPQATVLTNYAYSSTADTSLVIDGPIVANQDHYTLKIDVTQSQVTAVMYQGYDQTPIRNVSYPNNTEAFAVFIRALAHAGFTTGDNSPSTQDERGYCPSGERTIYQLTDGGNSVVRLWHTSCGEGTFKGSLSTVNYLFQQQITDKDLDMLTNDTNVSF